jgi:mTERF domain-containing protein
LFLIWNISNSFWKDHPIITFLNRTIDMTSKANALVKLRFLFFPLQHLLLHPRKPVAKTSLFFTTTTYSTISPTQVENAGEEVIAKNSIEVFTKWGCSESDICKILVRQPTLRKADVAHLQSKLNILSGLGISGTDLVKIINCRPRFLSCRINHNFDERLKFFMTLFESREVLAKAIVRNPSLLTNDFHNMIKPAIEVYEEVGVSRKDLIPLLRNWPTMIPRTTFGEEKMEYIRKTGISKDSKMYKYVVMLIGISRQETIRQKVANFEKLGLTEEETFSLLGKFRALTLSVDKVQRNMNFVLGTLKLPASAVVQHPFLLYSNLEAVLKPRVLLAEKIQDMGLNLQIKGPTLLTALRMTEKRFLKAFVECHPEDVANELMEFYRNAKGVKRLAEASKKKIRKGFPF